MVKHDLLPAGIVHANGYPAGNRKPVTAWPGKTLFGLSVGIDAALRKTIDFVQATSFRHLPLCRMRLREHKLSTVAEPCPTSFFGEGRSDLGRNALMTPNQFSSFRSTLAC